jgi:hypothetical protein
VQYTEILFSRYDSPFHVPVANYAEQIRAARDVLQKELPAPGAAAA